MNLEIAILIFCPAATVAVLVWWGWGTLERKIRK
jgi:hypothetical protein